jgi:hypothetical protein
MALALGDDEGLHRGDSGVVGEDCGDGVQEHAFAIAAGAVEKEQGVLPKAAGEYVAGNVRKKLCSSVLPPVIS